MFTGIIEKKGRIIAVSEHRGSRIVRIGNEGWRLMQGASIAVDGICSTVRGKRRGYFEVEYMPETLMKTTAADFVKGQMVNLERSLRIGGTIDGHFVQGHVDAVGIVRSVRNRGASKEITVRIPRALLRFIATHGSITIQGVSLTIARLRGADCTVALVSYSLTHTNLGELKEGDRVNIETDLLARYLARLVKK